ncbi:MAG: NifU family protein [bacterium]
MNELIEKILNERIRPLLARDGGNVEVIEVKDGVVKVKLTGACHGCPMAQVTITKLVEKKIMDELPEIKQVIAIS